MTLTAVFDGFDKLIQPADDAVRRSSEKELACFFAFVDRLSHDLLRSEDRNRVVELPSSPHKHNVVRSKIGVWRLALLEGKMPFDSSRRNSRVPKMLAHRLFPHARYALWIDSKLRLHQPPSVIRRLFLPEGSGAVFAAYRNLKRDHIDEERDWVWKHKCAAGVRKCIELLRQWAEYEGEQSSPDWSTMTVAIEGSLLLQDLRDPVHNALFCNWFNEYTRHGERDQMAMAYVLHRMGLTANGTNASSAVRFIGKAYHYLTKPSLRPLTLVVKLGHRSGSRKLVRPVR